MQNRFRFGFLLPLCVLLLSTIFLLTPVQFTSAAPLRGAITVTRLDDPQPDGCLPTDCSLREAIAAAAAGGASINLPVGTIELSLGHLQVQSGLISITGIGTNQSIIDANNTSRVFLVRQNQSSPVPVPCGLALNDLTITGGNALGGAGNSSVGGGIAVSDGCAIQLTGVVLRNNNASTLGGGLYKGIPDIGPNKFPDFIVNSAIISNTAQNGGGMALRNDPVPLSNVTISGNSASDKGGGLYFESTANFGGTTIAHTTIFNNSAPQGAGLAFEDQTPPQDVSVNIFNSIIAANETQSACATIGINTLQLNSVGYNLSDDESCQFNETTDIQNMNPSLRPLSAESDTFVHVPAFGSAVIDTGSAGDNTTDQRGLPRPVDLAGLPNTADGADRGAYEHQSVPPTAVTLGQFTTHPSPIAPYLAFAFLALGAVMVIARRFHHK